MRHFRLCALFFLGFTLLACGHEPGADHAHEAEPTAHRPAAEAHGTHEAHKTHGLELNGGEKWQMDEHTRGMFATMASRFEPSGTPKADPGETGKALQDDLGKLIEGCTMTGAAHDELHKFLVSYMPAVNKLASQGGAGNAREVGTLLEAYPTYFE